MLAMLAQGDPTLQLPGQYSDFAAEVDFAYYFVFWICVFFFVLIVSLVVFFAIKYRNTPQRREGEHTPTHHTALEMTWTIIPLVLVLAIFWFGFRGYVSFATPTPDAYRIEVNSTRWSWQFVYPNGAITDVLYLPTSRDVELVLRSNDVIHSFYVPEFRVKRDAVPERTHRLWFQPLWRENSRNEWSFEELNERIGGFPFDPDRHTPGIDGVPTSAIVHTLYCAEYCGQLHSEMIAPVVTFRNNEEFRLAVELLGEVPTDDPVAAGEMISRQQGCLACHSLEPGQVQVGPPFANLYGNERTLTDGRTVTADVEYVTRAIHNPRADTVAGFQDVMPPYTGLTNEEIANIIAFLRSISDGWDDEPVAPDSDDVGAAR